MTTLPQAFVAEQPTLLPQHQALLDASAIRPEVALARRYRSVIKRGDLKALGFSRSQALVPALLIPIYDVRGLLACYQLRPDAPRTVDGRVLKYETPKGARLLIDVPRDVREQLADPQVDLWLTEGSRKADAAVSRGLCCLALLGVWGWRGRNSKNGLTALADWESIALNDRKVYIAFDSDVTCKPSVRLALERLKAFLQKRGAHVKIVYLPAGAGGEKVGLDDYFAAGGTVADLLVHASDEVRVFEDAETDPRPIIFVDPGKLHIVVDKAEEALLASDGERLYERGGEVVRLVRVPVPVASEVMDRTRGTLSIVTVDVVYLVERFTRAARFQRMTPKGQIVDIDCPDKVAKTYLARRGGRLLDPLATIIECPVLRVDGSVLSLEGYDTTTGLYLDLSKMSAPAVPDRPTREEALAALATLKVVFKDFAFVAACDLSAALAGALTTLARVSIRTAPLTAVRAPKMGSGKSLIVDAIALFATGRVAAVMPQGKDDEEIRKRMLAILLAGSPLACIDNIERPLCGDTLCSVLTQSVYQDRILGKSETATVPTSTTWFATGNNMEFIGDITTRIVICDLDPRCEHPERRAFDVDLRRYVLYHRGELVAAGLTILRAYHVAGRPAQGLATFGRFEEWSDLVRSALVWLGEADPCEGIRRIEDADPTRTSLRAVLNAWDGVFGDRPVPTADALRAAEDDSSKGKAILEALREVAQGREGKPDARRLGKWLPKVVLRIEGNLRFERAGERSNAVLWRVRRVVRPSVTSDAETTASSGKPGDVSLVSVVRCAQPKPTQVVGPPQTSQANSKTGQGNGDSPQSGNSRPGDCELADRLLADWDAARKSGNVALVAQRHDALVSAFGGQRAAVLEATWLGGDGEEVT